MGALNRIRNRRFALAAAALALVGAGWLVNLDSATPAKVVVTASAKVVRIPVSATPIATAAPTSRDALLTLEYCGVPAAPGDASRPTPLFDRDAALARLTAFDGWLTDFRRADPAQRETLANAGGDFAAARRSALRELIAADPEEALRRSVPRDLRGELPAAVVAQL
ncbi:MAG: hypothetical protein RLZZ15_2901, partial [Verrucomicrobiota bacterium]